MSRFDVVWRVFLFTTLVSIVYQLQKIVFAPLMFPQFECTKPYYLLRLNHNDTNRPEAEHLNRLITSNWNGEQQAFIFLWLCSPKGVHCTVGFRPASHKTLQSQLMWWKLFEEVEPTTNGKYLSRGGVQKTFPLRWWLNYSGFLCMDVNQFLKTISENATPLL